MIKNDQIKLTEETVVMSYNLLTGKLANRWLNARNENAFKLEFWHILITVEKL